MNINTLALYSSDKTTIQSIVKALDYNTTQLIVSGDLKFITNSMAIIPPDLLLIDLSRHSKEERVLTSLVNKTIPASYVVFLSSSKDNSKDIIDLLHLIPNHKFYNEPLDSPGLTEFIYGLLNSIQKNKTRKNYQGLPLNKIPRVLVVEDSPLQMKVMLQYLEGRDMEIVTATDGLEALNKVLEHTPDLVLLDVVLPGMDGFEVCRRIKENPATSQTPVIIITSLTERENKLKSLRYGADDFLTKPIDKRELLLKTGNLLKRREQVALLSNQASRDSLTGLYNRRYLEIAINREIDAASRSIDKLSLVMLDVDHFKNYNDTNGHPAGDEVLKILGKILVESVRSNDICARYGGEEFIVVLPKTGPEGAFFVAEKIRKLVEEFPFPHRDKQPMGKVTVSLGIACFPDHATDAAHLIEMADKALYNAKKAGRNCVRIIDSL
ncbi:MAG: diguanylate cyclase [Peptococcaceae bacterium]|nr:diguanylate cyclase [Peptococcaceae bacterium]